MTAPTLVIGRSGQLARALSARLGDSAICLGRDLLDLAHPERARSTLESYEPAALINAAAYTQVDKAESEPDIAMRVNGSAPGVLAAWARERRIPFVHVSTDYVFSGAGTTPWREEDPVDPVNTYGKTKLAGEKAVEAAGGSWLVLRTQWVYDAVGRNFLNAILGAAASKPELRVVADQTGSPTYARDLADGLLACLDSARRMPEFPSGVFHLCNAGETQWNRFAEAILREARARGQILEAREVMPIPSAEYPTAARRPMNSRLSLEKTRRILGVEMPSWETGLRRCMDERFPRCG